jgi:hypothetical protein
MMIQGRSLLKTAGFNQLLGEGKSKLINRNL